MTFSLVIPTYNEARNILQVLTQLKIVLDRTGLAYEIIVVDDDRPDNTWRIVEVSRHFPTQSG